MVKNQLKWAIVGTGTIANEFASQFPVENASVYGIVSRTKEKAQAFAEKYQIPQVFDEYSELLKEEAIQVVYIATPHNTHHEYIMAALEAGKHVVCEKAITVNKQQLDDAYQLAQSKNLYLFEAMTIHFMPLYQKIFQWLAEQNLGPLKMIQVNFGSYKDTNPNYYYFNKDLAGGALLDIGVYALHFTRWFLSSKPTEIHTLGNLHESGVDESSVIILRNKENELANISLTFHAKMPKQGMVVYEEGYVTITDYPRSNKATLTKLSGETVTFEEGKSEQGLQYEIAAISDIILNEKENPYFQYSLDVLEVMDEVRKQWGLKYDFE
ncbi:MAG TPA: Gfo/Idh/MocA family oxidoreductase [Candidatus Jeotgalibaca pullicola]|nr:Gfo/Idh/MocA family oxidoreductase [Candidatus Jeotgalibaca pullicola]